jgi:hypothetical protein
LNVFDDKVIGAKAFFSPAEKKIDKMLNLFTLIKETQHQQQKKN